MKIEVKVAKNWNLNIKLINKYNKFWRIAINRECEIL